MQDCQEEAFMAWEAIVFFIFFKKKMQWIEQWALTDPKYCWALLVKSYLSKVNCKTK